MKAILWDDLIAHDRTEANRGEVRTVWTRRHRFEVEHGLDPAATWDEIAAANGVTRTAVQRDFERAVAKIELARDKHRAASDRIGRPRRRRGKP